MTTAGPASDTALVVWVSAPVAAAERLAEILVSERVAACVSLLPAVQSVYRWQGAVHKEPEALLMIKTATARYDELQRVILREHPYELPEIIATEIRHAHAPYLDWVLDNSR